jgi:apolipoprotein N-acyltransferase
MMIQRRWVRWAIGVPAILLFALAARKFPLMAVFVALVAGLAGLVYLITTRRAMSPLKPEQEREKHEPGAW